ncbi:uncharacterized protein LOC129940917 [Eupeodes corollae]|uniref:uncharacterized protein LOC129940917 n=1 Tax=Eupeodes corollae TaxID=290404 RepID=UPI002490F1C2|nr:uncharacterized protein LOC129940917 [Eupeodes corollae]
MSSYSFQGRSRVWIPRDEEENRAIFSAMRQETGITMPEEFKPIYLENEEYEVEKWSVKQLIKLLRLYGSHRCLWDPDDPFHKNRKMRKAAMIDITAAMGQDVTMEIVSQKINVIRSTYRYEKRRIKQRIKKGVGARTKLKWFALADSFLRNVPRADKFRKQDGPADSDSDLEDTIVFTIDPEILIPLEEDNSGNQNCITIGDKQALPLAKNDPEVMEINEQTEEIHQMLENIDDDDDKKFTDKCRPSLKWKSKQTIDFLKIYRKHKCLWDTRDENYRNRPSRLEAMKAMAKEFKCGIAVRQVSRKIIAMRSTYRMERRRLAEAAFKGDKQRSRLKWYPLADSFLRPFCKLKRVPGTSNILDEPSEYKTDDDNDEDSTKKPNDINGEENASIPDNDSDMEDDFNDIQSYDSEDEPIARLKIDLYIKHESDSEKKVKKPETKKDEKLQPVVKIPRIRIKPIVRPWMLAESIQFVELFHIHGCLWDRRHPNYKKLSERAVAFEDIAHKMDMPERRIRKKMKILLKSYYAERKKIEMAREKNEPYQTELAWYPMADEFLGRKVEEMPPPPSMAPMSFVDPDLMSPAPSLFRDSNEDKEIKVEAPDSPPRIDSPDHFDDVVDSPPPPEEPQQNLPSKTPPSQMKVQIFYISSATEGPQAEASLKTPVEVITAEIDQKPEVINDTGIKIESPPEDDFPKPESSEEQPTKIIWNGLEDDLLEGKWSLKNSVKFLRLYGAHRCLWDLNSPDYRVKELREAALEDIAAAMGHGLDAEYVWKKIKIFRITYMQHRKRMLEATKAGKEPEIQLRWFPLADSFLRPHIGLRSIKSDEKEMPQFDFQYVYANLNLIDPALLNDFEGKGTQNSIQLGGGDGSCGLGSGRSSRAKKGMNIAEQLSSEDEAEDDFDDGFFKKENGLKKEDEIGS